MGINWQKRQDSRFLFKSLLLCFYVCDWLEAKLVIESVTWSATLSFCVCGAIFVVPLLAHDELCVLFHGLELHDAARQALVVREAVHVAPLAVRADLLQRAVAVGVLLRRRHELRLDGIRLHEQGLARGRGARQVPGHLAAGAQRAGQDVEVGEDGGDGVAAVRQQPLGGTRAVADRARVVKQRRLAHGDEVLEEALAGVGEGGPRARVQRRAEHVQLVPREHEQLPDADEPLAEAALEALGALDVARGGRVAGLKVDVGGEAAAVGDAQEEEHRGEGGAQLAARNKGPEEPAGEDGRGGAGEEDEALAGGDDGRVDAGGGGGGVVVEQAEGHDGKGEAADEAGARVGAERVAVQHGDHVEDRKDGRDVGVAAAAGGRVAGAGPDGAEDGEAGPVEQVLQVAADARVHDDPAHGDSPPRLVPIPPPLTLIEIGGHCEE